MSNTSTNNNVYDINTISFTFLTDYFVAYFLFFIFLFTFAFTSLPMF